MSNNKNEEILYFIIDQLEKLLQNEDDVTNEKAFMIFGMCSFLSSKGKELQVRDLLEANVEMH